METTRKYKLFAAGCFFLVAALNLLDLACTYHFILRYGTGIEMNPLVVAMWNRCPALFVLFKVAASALFLICGLFWRKLKKWCVIVAVPAAVYAGVVGVSLVMMFTLPL